MDDANFAFVTTNISIWFIRWESLIKPKCQRKTNVAAILFIANLFYLFHWDLFSSCVILYFHNICDERCDIFHGIFAAIDCWSIKENRKIPFCHFSWLPVANATKWIHKVHVLMLQMWRQFECIHSLWFFSVVVLFVMPQPFFIISLIDLLRQFKWHWKCLMRPEDWQFFTTNVFWQPNAQ